MAGGGPLDGVYQCTASSGTLSASAFISVVGNPSGAGKAPAVFTVVATSANQPFFGFGIGLASATNFSGTTDAGRPFSLTATGDGLTGTAGVSISSQVVTANVNCSKIF